MPLNIDRFQREIKEQDAELRHQALETELIHEEAQLLVSLKIFERLGDMMMLLARNY
jgi:hypothetical protein